MKAINFHPAILILTIEKELEKANEKNDRNMIQYWQGALDCMCNLETGKAERKEIKISLAQNESDKFFDYLKNQGYSVYWGNSHNQTYINHILPDDTNDIGKFWQYLQNEFYFFQKP